MNIRFAREFHQSDFDQFKLCPRMFYYRQILAIDPERISEMALAGSALHATLAKAHAEKVWDTQALSAFFAEEFERRIAEAVVSSLEVQRGTIDLQEYHQMLAGYVAQPWNREAEVMLLECSFFFEIKPSSTLYQFAGRVDQVMRVPTPLLVPD